MPESEQQDPFSQLSRVRLEGGEELYSQPRMLQAVCAFEGQGLQQLLPLAQPLGFTVAKDRRAQLIYFRAGNSTDELIYLVLTRNGAPMRYFPIGARGAAHTPLAVIEDILPGTHLEVLLAAPAGVAGTVVVDVGFLEI
jgi:hypothetical protein